MTATRKRRFGDVELEGDCHGEYQSNTYQPPPRKRIRVDTGMGINFDHKLSQQSHSKLNNNGLNRKPTTNVINNGLVHYLMNTNSISAKSNSMSNYTNTNINCRPFKCKYI